jgi:hypothetical protein
MSPTAPQPKAIDTHRRQRDLVLASLLVRPGTPDPSHRRWA